MSSYHFNPFKSVGFIIFLVIVIVFFCAFGYIVG